ncbi:MAG: hypothetical protein KBD06_03720 [Candidatus Pacebacteria bacterium]|nr:hypothetical protein [Candidatus Paceibacterota bacterium]
MRSLFATLLVAASIGLVPTASALSRYAEGTPVPVSRTFTCSYYEVVNGENASRSFDVEATRDTVLHECFRKHNEIKKEANKKLRHA